MAQKKKINNHDNENLYICMYDAPKKRKNILFAIKNSLIMQEEHTKVIQIRKQKEEILNYIKRNLNDINSDYQNLKKLLPNVKNVIGYTEKELLELESQIDRLKGNVKYDNQVIKDTQKIVEKLEITGTSNLREISKEKEVSLKKEAKKKEPKMLKPTTKKPLSKLDRIKNNLSVIESKLNNL